MNMPLTPADVRNKQFSTTRLRPGYDEEEVDAFLDEVEAELDRLIQENEELRAKLAEVLRGGKVPALNGPHAEAPADLMAAEPPRREPERLAPPEPVMMPTRPVEDNMDTAARGLALAQQTADQAIAQAPREADATLGRAPRGGARPPPARPRPRPGASRGRRPPPRAHPPPPPRREHTPRRGPRPPPCCPRLCRPRPCWPRPC